MMVNSKLNLYCNTSINLFLYIKTSENVCFFLIHILNLNEVITENEKLSNQSFEVVSLKYTTKTSYYIPFQCFHAHSNSSFFFFFFFVNENFMCTSLSVGRLMLLWQPWNLVRHQAKPQEKKMVMNKIDYKNVAFSLCLFFLVFYLRCKSSTLFNPSTTTNDKVSNQIHTHILNDKLSIFAFLSIFLHAFFVCIYISTDVNYWFLTGR